MGTYRPRPFRLLAYPKGGGALRHYAVPGTDDQVAFTILAVLLGPLIDVALRPFAFGNRWYRALFRQRDVEGARWRHRPYALDTRHMYQPYRRDFSLFRRSAHWAASVMVGRDPAGEESTEKPFRRDEFMADELPECCHSQWWTGPVTRGYWARLDLRLAYPSVRVSVLGARLANLLRELPDNTITESMAGYPAHVSAALARREVRLQLAAWLTEALAHVRYDTGAVGDLWRPPNVAHDLPIAGRHGHPGIPTGLAFSGALLNCYLSDFDRRIERWLRARSPGQRAAVLRFADDIIVLGQTQETIAETLDAVWGALEGSESARLAAPRRGAESTNLRINWEKLEPGNARDVLGRYLKQFGWTEASEKLHEPVEGQPEVPTFAEWIRGDAPATWLDESQISGDRIGPFVTHLVERMSALGSETLDDRFGRGATGRLDELHQLLRLDIADPHVRNDTRLAFAANKIVRAFLPNEGSSSDHSEVSAIRNSVAEALLRVPSKFSLWRAVVHGACRRPLVSGPSDQQLDREDEEAAAWLVQILRRIADATDDPDSWLGRWPEESEPQPEVKRLYLSFLRSQFWLALAGATRDLRRLVGGDEQNTATPPHWSPSSWTFRALDERRAPRVLGWLAQLDRWANELYGEGARVVHWWEQDALASAALAQVDAAVAPAARRLSIPSGALADQPRVLELLTEASRVAPPGTDGAVERWAHAKLSVRPHGREELVALATELLSKSGSNRVRWAAGLGLLNFVTGDAAQQLGKLHRGVKRAPTLTKLEEYQRVRRVDLAFQRAPATNRRWTIHRLLWTIDDRGTPTLWPAAAPAIGLPPRVALRMLVESMRAELTDQLSRARVPVWTLLNGEPLWRARMRQHVTGTWTPLAVTRRLLALGTRWDVRPHAAYFLPVAVAGKRVDPSITRVWSHVLQFLTAAQGDESFLDHIFAAWPAPVPLEEKWALRADVPVDAPIWRAIDNALRGALANDVQLVRASAGKIVKAAEGSTDDVVRDFDWDRVDIALSLEGGELPVGCIPFHMRAPAPTGRLALPSKLPEKINVTIAQLSARPDWKAYRNGFFAGAPPTIPRETRQAVMAQFAATFASQPSGRTGNEEGPIIFPELALPLEEERAFRAQVLARRRAALTGLHWNVVRFAATGNAHAQPPAPTRYLVNEALLVVPVCHPQDPGVLYPREFRIRKPLPTHVEHSLAETLSAPGHHALGSTWRMLPGNRWYRFVHPAWGDFTVAICSDIIDPSPWKSLQGQILHLFLVSYNTDVGLYENLTWLRAYESYANVVATNHGHYGGSFAWTPAAGDSKEVARLRGSNLFLVADIRLNVASLASRQVTGVKDAVEDGKAAWTEASQSSQGETTRSKRQWKAPPPGYRCR